MPERTPGRLPDFPDVATPVARATVPPPFEQVVARARGRRRRTVVSVALAVGVLVGVVATTSMLPLGDRGAAPSPVEPAPTTASTGPTPQPGQRDALAIVQGGYLVSVARSMSGGLLTVWQLCSDGGACRHAWQLRTAGGAHRGLVSGSVPTATVAGDRFVVTSWDEPGIVVDPSGGTTPLRQVAAGNVRPGDVLVSRGKGGLALVDPGSAEFWPLPTEPGTEGWGQGEVATDGTIWALPFLSGASRISWSRTGSAWQHHVMPSGDGRPALPGYLAVSGDHVAAMTAYDGATVLPVADLAVTSDGGRTWTDLHQTDLPFRYVDSMAATSGGTLYLVTPGGEHLYRSTDATWTRYVEVPNPTHADTLVPAGDHVIARGGGTEPVLVALDDAGRAASVPLER
jgi:hypothetical protein